MLLSTQKLSELIGVSQSTLARWRTEGCGPAFMKAGRKVLYDSKNIEIWLLNSSRGSTSETVFTNDRAPPQILSHMHEPSKLFELLDGTDDQFSTPNHREHQYEHSN